MLALGDEGGGLLVALGDRARQRMIRRESQEARAEQRVRARGEHLDDVVMLRRILGDLEAHQQALRTADPVRLHQPHLVRPAVEGVERVEQVLGVVGDLEQPFGLLALLDQRARAPAPAVDHLLVGEHGLVDRIPIHLALLAVDEPGGEEIEKQPLLLVIVVGVAGRELATPVEREAHALQLRAHGGDVVVGPFGGMDAALDRRVLRRQAERVPAHRVQDVMAFGAHGAGNHVAHRIVPDVPHMDAPRRVGEHLEHVIFRARIVLVRVKQAALLPGLLPARLGFRRIVTVFRHGSAKVDFRPT